MKLDEKSGETRGAQAVDSKVSATKLKGAKAMRVERLLRKMEERSKRRQKRKEEVSQRSPSLYIERMFVLFPVGSIVSNEKTRRI